MRTARLPGVLVLLLPFPNRGFQDEPEAGRIALWRAHYARVERELRAYEPSGLDAARRAARAGLLMALAAYRERGDFTRQPLASRALVPQFVDGEGRRCAIAELLHATGATGRDELVLRVRAAANEA